MTNTAKKTQSLSYPADPLAAIRELQALDRRPEPVPPEPPGPPAAVAGEVALPVAPATGSEAGADPGPEGEGPTKAGGGRKRETPRRPEPPATAEEPKDVMERAILDMLGRPYAADPAKGPFTVTTVKVPAEVWERLGWASSLTGRPKQEIIALALKDWFAKLAKGR